MPTKTRGVTFRGRQIQAVLAGTMSQFRVPLKKQPPEGYRQWGTEIIQGFAAFTDHPTQGEKGSRFEVKCPYQPGDVLFLKETFRAWHFADPHIEYMAGGVSCEGDERCYTLGTITTRHAELELIAHTKGKRIDPLWNPSTHMPEWASRCRIRIKSVGVGLRQEISEEDAEACGMWDMQSEDGLSGWGAGPPAPARSDYSYRHAFMHQWNAQHARSGNGFDVAGHDWVCGFELTGKDE